MMPLVTGMAQMAFASRFHYHRWHAGTRPISTQEKGWSGMTAQRPDPSDDVPEADLLEQQIPVDPAPASDAGGAPFTESLDPLDETADPADRLEQQEVVPDDDDEAYPRE